MIDVPPHIESLKPYEPGKPIEELERELGITGSIKLASNENPLGPSPRALESLNRNLLEGLNRYPDGGGHHLRLELSERLGVKPGEIILGNGSNELLDLVVRTFMAPPSDEAVMGSPSFVVYPLSTRAQGCRAVEVPLKDYRHDLDRMAEAVTDKTKIVFIANPNNPTGTINTRRELDAFMRKIPEDVLVVFDEAYYEYVEAKDYGDGMKYFREGREVLVLRTFSKIHGLAGLRIGYGVGSERLLREINKIRPPFNTSTPAQAAALAALSDEEHIEASRKLNNAGKRYLAEEFSAMSIKFVPTEANFFYVEVGSDAKEIYESLLKDGVIVRPVGPAELRITIGTQEENIRCAKALEHTVGRSS